MMSYQYRHSVCLYVAFRSTNHFIILHKSRWLDSYALYIISKWLLKTRDLGFWHIHRSKLMLVNKHFQTWFLIGWQLSHMSVRSHARKSKLTYLDLNIFCVSNPSPACTIQLLPYGHYNQPVCIDQPLWSRYQQQNLKPCQNAIQCYNCWGQVYIMRQNHTMRYVAPCHVNLRRILHVQRETRCGARCSMDFVDIMVAVKAWMRCLSTLLRGSYDIYLGNLHLRYGC